MEKIEIRDRFTPFSHQSGVECLVPMSDYVVQVFPALIKVKAQHFPIAITGPVKEFTVQMDLDRDCVWIWGKAKEGHFRFKVFASTTGLSLLVDRCSQSGILIGEKLLQKKEALLLATGGRLATKVSIEKLSLGNWKAQDWDLVRRRANLKEIAPLLFFLGQKLPYVDASKLQHADHFFLAALSGICAPKVQDALDQGLPPFTGEPIGLIQSAYWTIRSYLIEGLSILPKLPANWDAGRILGLQTEFGTLDIEWTKGHIRRMIFLPATTTLLKFLFTSEMSLCHCNKKKLLNGAEFLFEQNKRYLFERFQK